MMFEYCQGDLLQSDAAALINPVNCTGVMGKGLAKVFKARFPQNYRQYRQFCQEGKLRPGILYCFEEDEKLIINFPTKVDWRSKSQLSYISDGLDELAKLLATQPIKSIAIPPLGCGYGGLDWNQVLPLIKEKLGPAAKSVSISIYGRPLQNDKQSLTVEKNDLFSQQMTNFRLEKSLAIQFIQNHLKSCQAEDEFYLYAACFFTDQILGSSYFGVRFTDGKFCSGYLASLSQLKQKANPPAADLVNSPFSKSLEPALSQSYQLLEAALKCGFSKMDLVILILTIQTLVDLQMNGKNAEDGFFQSDLSKRLTKLDPEEAIKKINLSIDLLTTCGLVQRSFSQIRFGSQEMITASNLGSTHS